MSDHVDGPRSMADPSIDLTDIYAFTSPEDPSNTVIVINVFPGAGQNAWFSNAAYYTAILKRVQIDGIEKKAAFSSVGSEICFRFKFESLERTPDDGSLVQMGTCMLPDGTTLKIRVGDIRGSSTYDGKIRVYAGLRSDPFFIGWYNEPTLRGGSNLTQDDNVLALVIEFNTRSVLHPELGSLFGVVGESSPVDKTPNLNAIPRFDWAGRPELANYLITIPGDVNLLDLWNQQTPYGVDPVVLPLFRERLKKHFRIWDMKDGKRDWSEEDLNANVNIFLNDFLLIDVSKKTTDNSNLEIEKSVINGRKHTTGGGRTLDCNAVDILLTWMINRDSGPFLQSPATQATKKAEIKFPYLAAPNTALLTIEKSVELNLSESQLWKIVGNFSASWNSLIAEVNSTGTGPDAIRTMILTDGRVIVERMLTKDDSIKTLKYELISGMPVSTLTGVLMVLPAIKGSKLVWKVNYLPAGQGEIFVRQELITWMNAGLLFLRGIRINK
ncbi:DUF4331 family protein [Polynucleobacter sp. MWH-UH23A]|uniref:DUF4331 family protein n=1 Tax=Polynucleobacter sp. MWH-UH23A TaxID=1855613 RepID=UPI003365252A